MCMSKKNTFYHGIFLQLRYNRIKIPYINQKTFNEPASDNINEFELKTELTICLISI